MSDPYSTEYTTEELENLPQTSQIFEPKPMVFNDHEWQQQGYMIMDNCSPFRADCHSVGMPIPSGKTLVKKGGEYSFVDEIATRT